MSYVACLDCGVPTQRRSGGRCPACAGVADKARRNPVRDTGVVRRARNAAIAAWVREHGYVCPGDEEHDAHAVAPRDLTADHPVRLVDGGAPVQAFRIVCRSANSRNGARGGGTHRKMASRIHPSPALAGARQVRRPGPGAL